MRSRYPLLLALCAPLVFGACADEIQGLSGPGVTIEVAPLSLPGIDGIEYAVAVFNQDPAPYSTIFNMDGSVNVADFLVWQQPSLTSGQYGNGEGGDISYVGPCDASEDFNWVALALKQIDVGADNGSRDGVAPFDEEANNVLDDQITSNPINGGDGDADFVNPCPYNAACVLSFACDENQDTEAVFNLTVMRDADQGFFDVAVNFEDMFCSAKFETCYDPTDPDTAITLLHGPSAGDPRQHTGVSALACTVGPKTASDDPTRTTLLLTTPTVECEVAPLIGIRDPTPVSFSIDLDAAEPGNGDVENNEETGYMLHYALYYGDEDLNCGFGQGSCLKVYYNIAINIENLAEQGLQNCELSYLASAIETGDTSTFDGSGTLIDPAAQYGAVYFGLPTGLPLTDGTTPPSSACNSHPLGESGSNVQPGYIAGSGYGTPGLDHFDYKRDSGAAAEAFQSDPGPSPTTLVCIGVDCDQPGNRCACVHGNIGGGS